MGLYKTLYSMSCPWHGWIKPPGIVEHQPDLGCFLLTGVGVVRGHVARTVAHIPPGHVTVLWHYGSACADDERLSRGGQRAGIGWGRCQSSWRCGLPLRSSI